jgi:hypothetical protein
LNAGLLNAKTTTKNPGDVYYFPKEKILKS